MDSPLFFLTALDLRQRLCVLFGGQGESLRRARELTERGAQLRVIAPQFSPEFTAWLASSPQVQVEQREPQISDLEGVWLAVQAETNASWADLLGPAAQERQIFFCAIDQPRWNSWAHVGIARAGFLQIGISTGGLVPGIAAVLRRQLQALLDQSSLASYLERLAQVRTQLPSGERFQRMKTWAENIQLEARVHIQEDPSLEAFTHSSAPEQEKPSALSPSALSPSELK